ncbi:hypothetical protein CHGG_04980 [Chaetomium globosum CBS 148.51]|uniref:Histidine kinase group protein n=1 Tax=Chaetomium globosum (strain ATCC 6205 / CBS 148.51 / DSM 1962 / NBRC 6347 / NRRL 1970) TaxID=306901 RepID=Q2GZR6_CHAGB|nr:uncharacterized protein CHGG_04980 [Chaetomium globosum CBS 148.51]EAQ88361.1 hypothetical protein CHGG_04980 [Chaetomium globosum CBS 148.51]
MPGKNRTELVEDDEHHKDPLSSPALPSLSPLPSPSQSLAATKQLSKPKVGPPPQLPQVLVICRNKHWRYISSFHGPWLQLPPEVLETIANVNYNAPRPRPIDPSVFFDLVKIRRLVDEATDLAVRAASGVATIGQRGLNSASHPASMLGFGFGHRPPPQTKLSPERKHRMREQATQKLMEAYCLDEIASSVATMQGASTLEEVACLVLQRNPQDPAAKYVHFFHEKIPSRQLVECTSMTPLNEVAAVKPSDPAPLRTRAMVRVLKGDDQGAADDLTEALKLHRLYGPSHASRKSAQLPENQSYGANRRQEDAILKGQDQPSSLEMQLIFQRAGIYLVIACRYIPAALGEDLATAESHSLGGAQAEGTGGKPQPMPAGEETQRRMEEARKLVRQNAKRALRDYTAYLSHFDYSPDLPIEHAEDFTRRVNSAVNGTKAPRSHSHPSGPRLPQAREGEAVAMPHRVYALSDLFTSSQPAGLPPYPSTQMVTAARGPPPAGPVQTTTETLTCHPLLADALHALLLCHCLLQTSAKELLRHANMVARLARLADGYPVFQSSRCPTRADWIEVLRAGNNWINLAGSWEDLCAPAPLPLFQSTGNGSTPVPISPSPLQSPLPTARNDTLDITSDPSTTLATTGEQAQGFPPNPIDDDRRSDDAALRLAIRARQMRAERDYRVHNAALALDAQWLKGHLESPLTNPTAAIDAATSTGPPPPAPGSGAMSATSRRGAMPPPVADDKDFHPLSSQRAGAIARWVTHAPPPNTTPGGGDGTRKRRKKPVKKTTVVDSGGGGGVVMAT